MSNPLTIWSNAGLPADAVELIRKQLGPHRLIFAPPTASNLVAGGPDPQMATADVAFGQPDPQQVIDCPNIKWVHLTSAGYTRYDYPAFREALRTRGGIMTNSSGVYDAPCAEHALAMIMAFARQLPQALEEQLEDRGWPSATLRINSRLLDEQTALIYGFGSIARRLVQLLKPLGVKITGVRRTPRGDEGIPIVNSAQADSLLPTVDHVINILPASPETDGYFTADRLARMNPSAIFYNIGRGSTVDQQALRSALESGRLAAAYLDVCTPEPLPPDHPLWKTLNCYITPHTAGGHRTEFIRIAKHFLRNLELFMAGKAMEDKVI
jgi:phosphoglycerate dehydrogenase-like enzyme